jgi:5-methylcytosine-specific restriction endonuclease McrA
MPYAAPSICGCGKVVNRGLVCPCQQKRRQESKARFDAKRPSATARGYDNRWRQASKEHLSLNARCSHPGCNAYATVVDHITPHRGDMRLFWNKTNWQGLCAHHHNSAKQRIECQ